MTNKIEEAIDIYTKWKDTRDSAYFLLTSTEPDDSNYKTVIGRYQHLINAICIKNKIKPLEVVLRLATDDTDAYQVLLYLAAGYELAKGNDYSED